MQLLLEKDFVSKAGVAAHFFYRPANADECTIQATYRDDEYNLQNFKPNPGDLMIDAGGYIGTTAILYAQLYPEAKVVTLEPLPENVEILRKNIEANKLGDRITILPHALWGELGNKIKVYYRDDSKIGLAHKFVGSSFPKYHESVSKQFVEAEALTLDQVMRSMNFNNVRLLKMDIEGAEFNVLANTELGTLAKIQSMVGEYHDIEPENKENARLKLYLLVTGKFENRSPGEGKTPWGPFYFERRIPVLEIKND
jgi:FkbM family methyltransferase